MTGKSCQQSEHERQRLPRQQRLAMERKLICVRHNGPFTIREYTVNSHFSRCHICKFACSLRHLKFPKSMYSAFGHLWTWTR